MGYIDVSICKNCIAKIFTFQCMPVIPSKNNLKWQQNRNLDEIWMTALIIVETGWQICEVFIRLCCLFFIIEIFKHTQSEKCTQNFKFFITAT